MQRLRDEGGGANDPQLGAETNLPDIRKKGFARLGQVIGRKSSYGLNGKLFRAAAGGDIYVRWCVERVAVMYDVPLIEGKDWYQWGSQVLLDAQKQDGSWADRYDPAIDTSFAILFLKRANLAKDVTTRLRAIQERPRAPTIDIPPPVKEQPTKKKLFN